MDRKKDKDEEARVSFRGVNPYGQTAKSLKILDEVQPVPATEAVLDVLRQWRPRTVKDVVGSLRPVLAQLLDEAPDLELSQETAEALRVAVASAAKEVLGKIKK